MKSCGDKKVINFVARYLDDLEELASGTGEQLGFITPIEEDTQKMPFPCVMSWSNSQQFEITDDVQQCIKVRFIKKIVGILNSYAFGWSLLKISRFNLPYSDLF